MSMDKSLSIDECINFVKNDLAIAMLNAIQESCPKIKVKSHVISLLCHGLILALEIILKFTNKYRNYL